MKFALFIVGICVLLMIVIVVVAYICDRIRTGRNTPPPDGQTSATMLATQCWRDYQDYTQIMIDCVANNYTSCGLTRPGELPQHMKAYPHGVDLLPDGNVGFLICFDRGPELSRPGQEIRYSTVPLRSMARKINETFPNYCLMAGYAPYQISGARDASAGRVEFLITPVPGVSV